jgi:hypothetical protein
MAYQMTITLTDAEYAALSREAIELGKPIESLLHEILAQRMKPSTSVKDAPTSRKIQEYLYHEGLIEHIPTGEPRPIDTHHFSWYFNFR